MRGIGPALAVLDVADGVTGVAQPEQHVLHRRAIDLVGFLVDEVAHDGPALAARQLGNGLHHTAPLAGTLIAAHRGDALRRLELRHALEELAMVSGGRQGRRVSLGELARPLGVVRVQEFESRRKFDGTVIGLGQRLGVEPARLARLADHGLQDAVSICCIDHPAGEAVVRVRGPGPFLRGLGRGLLRGGLRRGYDLRLRGPTGDRFRGLRRLDGLGGRLLDGLLHHGVPPHTRRTGRDRARGWQSGPVVVEPIPGKRAVCANRRNKSIVIFFNYEREKSPGCKPSLAPGFRGLVADETHLDWPPNGHFREHDAYCTNVIFNVF